MFTRAGHVALRVEAISTYVLVMKLKGKPYEYSRIILKYFIGERERERERERQRESEGVE
jgi:hypothetical protein